MSIVKPRTLSGFMELLPQPQQQMELFLFAAQIELQFAADAADAEADPFAQDARYAENQYRP